MGTPLVGIPSTSGIFKEHYGILSNYLNQRSLNYELANRNNERFDRDSKTGRLLRHYWGLCVGNNTHYKNICDFDALLYYVEEYFLSNPQPLLTEEIQQEYFYNLIEQANQQALRDSIKSMEQRVSAVKREIDGIDSRIKEEIRRDQQGETCTQRFIDQL